MRSRPSELFTRYQRNPILRPEDWPYTVNAVFNPGATRVDGTTVLLVRVEATPTDEPADGPISWRELVENFEAVGSVDGWNVS